MDQQSPKDTEQEWLDEILDRLVTDAHNHTVRGNSIDFVLRDIEQAKAAINDAIRAAIDGNIPHNVGCPALSKGRCICMLSRLLSDLGLDEPTNVKETQ